LPEAPDPRFRERVAAEFARQGFMRLLGARLVRVEPGACEIELAFRPDLTQHHGFFHAGVLTTLADNAAGFAAISLMPPGVSALSVEFKLNFLRPGRGVAAVARGTVVKPGRTLMVVRAEAYGRAADGAEEHCATMLATMMRVAEGGGRSG